MSYILSIPLAWKTPRGLFRPQPFRVAGPGEGESRTTTPRMLRGTGGSKMAAGRGSCRTSSSSEEEEEELQRLREAAWDPHAGDVRKSVGPSAEPSIRGKSKDRGQKGNELQTTPEFQAHVAKKLGAILDSSISISEHTLGPARSSRRDSEVDGDVGFRLFSSSVPGSCGKPEPAPLGRRRRRRQHRSSSSEQDSDQEWQRCQEAAVSAEDILRLSGFPAALQNASADSTEASQRKKKRRRKKATAAKAYSKESDEGDAVETVQSAQIGDRSDRPLRLDGPRKKERSVGGEDRNGLFGNVIMKKKKKKKKTGVRTD